MRLAWMVATACAAVALPLGCGSTSDSGAGGGGSGGTSSSAGASGPECTAPEECPADGPCWERLCDAGECGQQPREAGYLLPDGKQIEGDCQVLGCDGDGNELSLADDDDVAPSTNPCVSASCSGGVPMTAPEPAGTSCGDDAQQVCDGQGTCVGCVGPESCPPGYDEECFWRTCDAEICGLEYADFGTLVASQVEGDCKDVVCNGMGGTVEVDDDLDAPPPDGSLGQCHADVCVNGQLVQNAPLDGNVCAVLQTIGACCDGTCCTAQCCNGTCCAACDSGGNCVP